MNRLQLLYKKEQIPNIRKEFKFHNDLEVPRINKIVINSGVGRSLQDPKFLEQVTRDLARITGQKPITTKAKSAISGFKLRKGAIIGTKVTLRGNRMFDFLDRLINISLPRIRDFRGINLKSFDKSGNLTIGIKEHSVFPEISLEHNVKPFSFEITIVITNGDKKINQKLFEGFGMIFSKK